MSYTNQTTHYGIPLPTSGDLVNLLDWNQSSEDIDAAIYGAAEAAQQAGSDIQAVAGDVSQLQTDLGAVQGDVTAIDGRVTSLEQTSGTLDEKVDDIADMITPREVTSAQSNIRVNVDELFRYNDVLYKCTVQINIGDTIVPNVNCTATNVETELAAGGGGGAEIDDTTTSASKVWSSQKTSNEISAVHTGDVRFSNGKLQQYNGSAWVDVQIGGGMKSIQKGTGTIPIGGNQDVSISLGTAVDPGKSIVLLNMSTGSNSGNAPYHGCYVKSLTANTLVVTGDAITVAAPFSWQVVEYN